MVQPCRLKTINNHLHIFEEAQEVSIKSVHVNIVSPLDVVADGGEVNGVTDSAVVVGVPLARRQHHEWAGHDSSIFICTTTSIMSKVTSTRRAEDANKYWEDGGMDSSMAGGRRRRQISLSVSWCFKPSQPQRTTSVPETDVNPSPNSSALKSSHCKTVNQVSPLLKKKKKKSMYG